MKGPWLNSVSPCAVIVEPLGKLSVMGRALLFTETDPGTLFSLYAESVQPESKIGFLLFSIDPGELLTTVGVIG